MFTSHRIAQGANRDNRDLAAVDLRQMALPQVVIVELSGFGRCRPGSLGARPAYRAGGRKTWRNSDQVWHAGTSQLDGKAQRYVNEWGGATRWS